MSFAFMPLYTGDYQRDTRHLSPMKHGIYLCLLMHCWDQKGPCPLDEQECSGIANCRSSDEMEALQYVLSKFFVQMDDGFYNTRMQQEIEKAHALSVARSGAGRKGYEAKAKQLLSKSQASAKQVPLPPPPHSPPPPEKEKAEARATRFAINKLPADWELFCKQERPDLNPSTVFDGFRDWWIAKAGKEGRKLDWLATWRNWVRNQRAAPAWAKTRTSADIAQEAMNMLSERDQQDAT